MASRAVILARVSTKEQELEGYSLDAQERLLVEYSKQHALRVMRTFRISETASKKDERRTFDEMMRYVARNHIPHLVCEKVDRLLRNFKDTVMIEAWLEEDTARRLHLVKNSIVLHKNSAESSGQCITTISQQLFEFLRRRFPSERFPWPPIELIGDLVQVKLIVRGKVGSFRKVLAEQAVGVLVATALPRRVRVAEEHRNVGGYGELGVRGHLDALVPGQRPSQRFG